MDRRQSPKLANPRTDKLTGVIAAESRHTGGKIPNFTYLKSEKPQRMYMEIAATSLAALPLFGCFHD